MECFDHKDTYLLVDIAKRSNRSKNVEAVDLAGWLDNI